MAVVFGTFPVDKRAKEMAHDVRQLTSLPGCWARFTHKDAVIAPESYYKKLVTHEFEEFNPEHFEVAIVNREVWVRAKHGIR